MIMIEMGTEVKNRLQLMMQQLNFMKLLWWRLTFMKWKGMDMDATDSSDKSTDVTASPKADEDTKLTMIHQQLQDTMKELELLWSKNEKLKNQMLQVKQEREWVVVKQEGKPQLTNNQVTVLQQEVDILQANNDKLQQKMIEQEVTFTNKLKQQ